MGVLYHSIWSFLPIASHLHCPFAAYYALVFAYLSLWSQNLVTYPICQRLPSVLFGSHSQGPH